MTDESVHDILMEVFIHHALYDALTLSEFKSMMKASYRENPDVRKLYNMFQDHRKALREQVERNITESYPKTSIVDPDIPELLDGDEGLLFDTIEKLEAELEALKQANADKKKEIAMFGKYLEERANRLTTPAIDNLSTSTIDRLIQTLEGILETKTTDTNVQEK